MERVVSQKGIALMVVMWVMAILMVTVLSFSYLTRTETLATLGFKESAEKRMLAEAGIERAIMELFYRRQNVMNTVILEGAEVWKADGTVYEEHLGDGSYTVSIRGEAGKLDINRVPDLLLKNLLLNAGVKDDAVDTIVDSVLDWRTPGDLARLHGAKSDYYMSLPNPYKAKNADFDTLEELLLVKGVTPAILYGQGEQKGIIDSLTVYAGSAQIYVNYASRDTLMALPGVTGDMADAIIQQRDAQPFKSPMDLQGILGSNYGAAMVFATIGELNVFTIEAVGYKGDKKAGYPIKATVIIDNANKYRYLYYKSPAYKS